MLHKKTQAAIEAHALAEYPREACGLIVAAGRKEEYIRCRNLAASPREQFRMPAEDWADAEDRGKILAVVHSHPDAEPYPSEADRIACEGSGVPWVIVSVRDGTVSTPYQFAPTGYKAPLLGRPFFHGVLDCYSMIRDVYQREFGIELLEWEREDDWWNAGKDYYMDRFEQTGFRKLGSGEQPQPGDVVLMAIHAPVANHAGVYLDTRPLGEAPHAARVPNAMIHHLYGRLSERVVYGGYWAEQTRAILRHKCLEQSDSTAR